MKCPCCDSEITPTDFMYYEKRIYINNEWHNIPAGEGRVLARLKHRPMQVPPHGKGSLTVLVSRIRGFLRETGVPFGIYTINGQYVLRRIDHVQNNNHAQRSEDIHS